MHFPVLLKEVKEYLDPVPGDVILDATVGGGGHAAEILERIVPEGRLIAVDRDPEAVERSRHRLRKFSGKVIYINDNFRNIDRILKKAKTDSIDGAVFDLGISSFQVDDERRGFSFLKEGPLDMRFNAGEGLTAADVVNGFGREELADIIKQYGEERYAGLLAGAIIKARKKKKIETTDELAEIISRAAGGRYRRQKLHPACRTFQALRIFVNDELNAAGEAVKKTILHLRPGARICVISFHSLEDRIVKNIFRHMAKNGDVKIITKKPVVPTAGEIRDNHRSRSAKLRVAERMK